PPVAPCMMRKTISRLSVGASPHRNDEAVKPTTDNISRRLRPNALASHPVIGRMIALATRYDVSAQVASSIDADRLPAMCGSDTLTTVVSNTSMKVANITEIAMSQGLIGRCASVIALLNPCVLCVLCVSSFHVHRRHHRHPRSQE